MLWAYLSKNKDAKAAGNIFLKLKSVIGSSRTHIDKLDKRDCHPTLLLLPGLLYFYNAPDESSRKMELFGIEEVSFFISQRR